MHIILIFISFYHLHCPGRGPVCPSPSCRWLTVSASRRSPRSTRTTVTATRKRISFPTLGAVGAVFFSHSFPLGEATKHNTTRQTAWNHQSKNFEILTELPDKHFWVFLLLQTFNSCKLLNAFQNCSRLSVPSVPVRSPNAFWKPGAVWGKPDSVASVAQAETPVPENSPAVSVLSDPSLLWSPGSKWKFHEIHSSKNQREN